MTDHPSDRAIAQAFWEHVDDDPTHRNREARWHAARRQIEERATKIDRTRTLDAAPADPINQTETDSKLIVPSAECWRRAMRQWFKGEPDYAEYWIEQRAIELAREGK